MDYVILMLAFDAVNSLARDSQHYALLSAFFLDHLNIFSRFFKRSI